MKPNPMVAVVGLGYVGLPLAVIAAVQSRLEMGDRDSDFFAARIHAIVELTSPTTTTQSGRN